MKVLSSVQVFPFVSSRPSLKLRRGFLGGKLCVKKWRADVPQPLLCCPVAVLLRSNHSQVKALQGWQGWPPEHPPAAQPPVQQSGRRPQHPPPQRRPGPSCSPLLGDGQDPPGPRQCRKVGSGARRAAEQGGQRSKALRRRPCARSLRRGRAALRSLPARGAAAASIAPLPAPGGRGDMRSARACPRRAPRPRSGPSAASPDPPAGRRRGRERGGGGGDGRGEKRREEERREARDAPQVAAAPPSFPWPRRCPAPAGCAPREAASRGAALRGAGASR
ncbi:class A basic helix-loop-helix protein 9-like [Aphelocoma coerulescens]|uniref:class A basic helix-loop-helix protein 9-like n=1 Tax=Aphelocoma coerulescens TaxID=39617 RepID=UPI00360509F5